MKLEKSIELFTKGKKHLVGAVNSPVRAFKSVGGEVKLKMLTEMNTWILYYPMGQ